MFFYFYANSMADAYNKCEPHFAIDILVCAGKNGTTLAIVMLCLGGFVFSACFLFVHFAIPCFHCSGELQMKYQHKSAEPKMRPTTIC